MADATRDRPMMAAPAMRRRASTTLIAAPPPTGWLIADAVLGVVLLLLVVIVGNADGMPRGLNEFLAVRISLKNVLLLTGFAVTWPLVLWSCGLYRVARLQDGKGEWPRLLVASLIAGLIAMIFPLTSQSGAAQPMHAFIFAMMVAPSAAVVRSGVRAARQGTRQPPARRTLIVGSGPNAAQVYRGFDANPLVRRQALGFVDTDPQPALVATGLPYLGSVDSLEQVLMRLVVDEVLITLPVKSRYEEIQRAIGACELVGVSATYPAPIFSTGQTNSRIKEHAMATVMALPLAHYDARHGVKRVIDIVGSAVMLLVLSPLFALVALAIRSTSPGPVFFRQERFGFRRRHFHMLKFRSMVDGAEAMQPGLEAHNEAAGPIFKIKADPRMTRIGKFLRRSSLDELPQLWHVLTGEMSLVGPRPMSLRDVARFEDPWLMRRFSVRPGLTCLWQVSGRSNLTFAQWIALDLEYVDRWSLALDASLLLKTIPAVLKGTGAQ